MINDTSKEFIRRHIGPSEEDTKEMLKLVGADSLDDLMKKTVPDDILFKEKLKIDFQRYRILGACNPPLAHKALTAELEVGMLMPCNVVIWENLDSSVTISVGDAEVLLSVTEADLHSITSEANQRLKKAVDAV